MQEIQLNSRELLYIASTCGADEFYGVPDGFYGMDEAEISAEINNIKLSLVNKNYAEMDFDGEFAVKDDVMQTVRTCAERDKYISFDRAGGKGACMLRFYIKGNTAVSLTEQDAVYTLKPCFPGNIKEMMTGFIKWYEEMQVADERIVLEKEQLGKVKLLSEFDNPQSELKLMGCKDSTAEILYGGLSGLEDYYSMLVIDFASSFDEVKSLMFINSDKGILKLTPVWDEERELIEIMSVSQNVIIEKLDEILSQYLPELEEEFS